MRFTPVPGCGREEESSRDRSWYQKEWKSSQVSGDNEPEGYREWPPRHSGTNHSQNRRCECQHGGQALPRFRGGKKHKSQPWEVTWREFLNVTSEDLWRLQKILHSNKGSLSKTHKTNTEANAKVYDLNQKTMKAVDTLAFLHSTFERAGKNLGEVDDSEGQRRPEIRGNHPGTGLQSAR